MKKIIIFIILIFFSNCFAKESYFDLSEKEIQIQTDFNGKEIIIFGTMDENFDTIISIKGPDKDTKVLKKERLLGFWFNTKSVIYKKIPSVFFLSSSKNIKEILDDTTIIKEKLYFNELLTNTITKRNFIDQKDLLNWNNNLINIKTSTNLFKEYDFKNINNKLFQVRVFFPSNSIPGNYDVTIYQVKDKVIKNKKNRVINIKKSGVGEKIYKFAHSQPSAYGLLTIIFAILSGLIAATLFRRL
tara:strand:- start:190 stop:921 length:732 start_codon:yes stop_codon:yes gene_type:complete